MPRNSSGTYTLPSGNPVVSGTLIEASWANNTLSDLAAAMTNSLSRNGEGGMTAALRLFDGTVSLPGLAFTNETSTGLYRAGSGDMRLAVTGSQVVQFLTTGVAVTGTLSASGNTTLSGALAVTGASTFSGQTNTFENSTAYYPQLINRNKTADANGSYISLQKIRNTSIVQNGDVLGNVIFAGYDGAAYLQGAYINAVISATPGLNDMPTDLVFGTTPDGGAGPVEGMRLDKNRNLGLGVTPSAWSLAGYAALQVGNGALWASTTSDTLLTSNSYYNGGWKYSTTRAASQYEQFAGAHYWYNAPSGTAGNAISFTQAMTLDASGNLGIGTTSTTNYILRVNAASPLFGMMVSGTQAFTIGALSGGGGAFYYGSGNAEAARIDSSGVLRVNNTSTPSGNTGFGGEIAVIGNGSNGSLFYTAASAGAGTAVECTRQNDGAGIYFFRNGSAAGFINITTGAISVNNSSDYRLKENVETLTGSLAKVMQVRPVTFTWKENGAVGKSVIAHELQEVFPDVVFGDKDAVNEDGSIKPQSVALGNLVPDLIIAIQELKAIVDAQAAEIAALKGQA